LEAFNPYYGYRFFAVYGKHAWVLMGAIVLCVTGCEAMYADMGHFGKNPVRCAWLVLVYPSLLLNYIGQVTNKYQMFIYIVFQGAMLMKDPSTINNPFYNLVPIKGLYIPVVILSTLATVVASQALISGAFSISQQAISLGTFPRMKVVHTSDKFEGQIYIPTLNYMLMIVCVILVVSFKSSTALSNAYGLAVCGDMTLSTLLFSTVARFRWKWHPVICGILFVCLLIVDGLFFTSTLLKIPNGGYVPLIIAFVVSSCMYIWRRGKAMLNATVKASQPPFQELQIKLHNESIKRCPGK
jgi:KUP system potassium uptake protein